MGWLIYHLRCELFDKKKEIITLSSNFCGGRVRPTLDDEMSRREQMVFVVSYTLRPPSLYYIIIYMYIIFPYYTYIIYIYRHYLSYSPFASPLSRGVLHVPCTLSTPYFRGILFFAITTINHPPKCNYCCHEIIILHPYNICMYIYSIIFIYYIALRMTIFLHPSSAHHTQ